MSTSDVHSNGVAGAHPTTTTPTTSNDPEAIREDIERTRNDLADTVDALQAKLDVKAQAKARVARVREQARTRATRVQAQARTGVARVQDQATTDDGKPRPEVVAGTAGAVLLVVGLLWWRRD